MSYRLTFLCIAIFWVTMNVLLWRAEFGRHDAIGSAVPVATVWRKMLTAPDNSSLAIRHHGKVIGFCRWVTETVGATNSQDSTDEPLPEDMVSRVTGYRASFDGSVTIPALSNRVRFDFNSTLATNHDWRTMSLRMSLRRDSVLLESSAAAQTLRFKFDGEHGAFDNTFKFSDLQNPQALLRTFQLPLPMLADLDLPKLASTNAPQLGLNWTSREDRINLGHTSTRAYRVQARLLDRYNIVVIISRAGEILRVELPDEIVLLNDQLTVP